MSEACGEGRGEPIVQYFQLLGDLGRESGSAHRTNQALRGAVTSMVRQFGLDHAALMAVRQLRGHYVPVAVHGVSSARPIRLPEAVESELTGAVDLFGLKALCNGSSDSIARHLGSWVRDRDALITPLLCHGELVGVFIFDRRVDLPPMPKYERRMLCDMCQNVAVYLQMQIAQDQLTQRTKAVYTQTIMAFLTAIHIKDGYTKEHSRRVAEMAAALARDLDFSEHEVEGIYFAGLLHDIGKILVDKHILNKPGALDLTEYAEMSQHTELGAEILSHIHFPWENLVYAIEHHHDSPTCDPLRPREARHLELGARIIVLADAFDAMTSDRPYRRALRLSDCLAEILSCLGSQFDPEVTLAFLRILENDLLLPNDERRILNESLLREDELSVHAQIAAAIRQLERMLGVALKEA